MIRPAVPELAYAPLDEIERGVLADLLDAQTRGMTCGPGMMADDQEHLLDMFALRLRSIDRFAILMGDRLAGTIEFCHNMDRPMIGFSVHRDMRRMGIFAKAWRDLHPRYGTIFEAHSWEHNTAARRALLSVGFRETGIIRRQGGSISVAFMDRSA